MELLDRLLPRPPAQVLDVGGGPGTYAAPLARRGYRVHLVDPVPLHVEQARQAAGDRVHPGLAAALGVGRPAPARAHLVRRPVGRGTVLAYRLQGHLIAAATRP